MEYLSFVARRLKVFTDGVAAQVVRLRLLLIHGGEVKGQCGVAPLHVHGLLTGHLSKALLGQAVDPFGIRLAVGLVTL